MPSRPTRRKARSLERPILRSILEALERRRYFHWRANSGMQVIAATDTSKRKVIRGAIAGTPDILVLLPGGRLLGLEVKSPTGTQQESQKLWQARAEALGAGYALVRSAAEALRAVEVFAGTGAECARGGVGSMAERIGGVSG